MAVKYVKDFSFPSSFGFSGSATPGYAGGGAVQRRAMGGPAGPSAQPAPSSQEPTITMPMSTAQNLAKGLATAGAERGVQAASQPLPGATVGGPLSAPPQRLPVAPMGARGPVGTPVPMKKGGYLNAAKRDALPKSDFALPGAGAGSNGKGSGSYPIPDAAHARSALSRVSANGSPSQQAAVRAKVHSKFPAIGKK